MATKQEVYDAYAHMLVALNGFEKLGLDVQNILDFRQAIKAEGRQITEEDVSQIAETLASQ